MLSVPLAQRLVLPKIPESHHVFCPTSICARVHPSFLFLKQESLLQRLEISKELKPLVADCRINYA
jgi:hypothetical protein